MNLAQFLHGQKEFKDSTLPLPLAPCYSLPHHKWYFSSPMLVPLRKRKQNTSFYKYLIEVDESQHSSNLSTVRELICIYQKNNYLDSKLMHIFELFYTSFQEQPGRKVRISCQCNQYLENQAKIFKSNSTSIQKCLQQSKKSFSNQTAKNRQQHINWYQLTKNIISSHVYIMPHNIPEESLFVFRLPDSKQEEPCIFNILWNNNYLVFNNGNELNINPHMKSKAVALCDLLARKLQAFIWNKIETMIQKRAETITDHQKFIDKIKNDVKISTFKIWFYKKEQNNQIYIICLSQITLKGVECVLYNNSNLGNEIPVKIKALSIINDQLSIYRSNQSLTNKFKTYSLSRHTNNSKTLIPPKDRVKMMEINSKNIEAMITDIKKGPQKQMLEGISQIQCCCCKDLLATGEIVNQITAKHIHKIRYLRQMKIGKDEYCPYQFIKICALCYGVYLKHYKENQIKQRKTAKPISQSDKNIIKDSSRSQKRNFSFHDKVQAKMESHQSSSKRLIFGKNIENRGKRFNSETNNYSTSKIDTIQSRQKEISMPMRPFLVQIPRQKKTRNITTNSTNTENTIINRQQLNQHQKVVSNHKNMFQQQISSLVGDKILVKSNSHKLKGKMVNKTYNIINKIIVNSIDCKNTTIKQSINKDKQMNENVDCHNKMKDKILINAISQYQNIQRPSFKKLVYKNHRNYIVKQPAQQYIDDDISSVKWKRDRIFYI